MTSDWPWALLLVLISPAVGSFLGVVVDRLLRRVPVLMPASTCSKCSVRLAWRDMVPVLSAVRLGGRCRSCDAPFPGYLMRIEIGSMLAALIVVAWVPGVLQMWVSAAVLWCLIGLFYSDLIGFRLPDPLTGALLLLGMLYAGITHGVQAGVIGAVVGVGAFWLIRWGYFQWRGKEGLGLGDVKLMAGLGAIVGWSMIPLLTLVAAGLALVITLLAASRTKERIHPGRILPFGSYLCVAGAIVMFI